MEFEFNFSQGKITLKAKNKEEAFLKLVQIEYELECLLDATEEVTQAIDEKEADEQLKKSPKISEFLKKL